MQRIPEAELMEDPAQALAYAEADFSEPHNHFIALFRQRFGTQIQGTLLDLGCGPGDICQRFANAFPDCLLHGLDASEAMLGLARKAARERGLEGRIQYVSGYLPDAGLPTTCYDTIISNSLLHHLRSPEDLWVGIQRLAKPGARVFIMDLLRPETREQATQLVKTYAGNEPDVLQKDFFNSLLAAYRPEEVEQQLQTCAMEQLGIEVVSDRHFVVHGCMPA